ncbi:MAG: phosphoenolpyruvate carboxykinase (GTP) [Wenzhouxiangellaceae bacterium]
MTTTLTELADWVEATARRTGPDRIVWCDGSREEYDALVRQMLGDGTLIELNQTTHPDCYLHRSDPGDVARVEHLTFVCTHDRDDAGPNNHWMDPAEARRLMDGLFEGCMAGRTMYVIPYCMGPIESPHARLGVEITDSPYVVVNMHKMTRMGRPALDRIEREGRFVKGLHSIGELDPDRRFIMHFPEALEIQSYGSGYGGNALLGKKCHALRIASWQARQEGWLAEHMLIVGIENPAGETRYIAAAFPSACGKTNLAMLIPPEPYRSEGWKVHTVGDDICWLHPGADGRLWAINPEAGFFGVAPGTSSKTNPNALAMLNHDTIFTNVALTADGQPWWEGLDEGEPAVDWQGRPYDPANGPAAHPNARFTVSMHNCPSYTPAAEAPSGVPIDAIIFGGRRARLAPLVLEAFDWVHGTFLGASMASETTAAATGKVGVVRRDPMAMKPFCGYHFGDYWAHWLDTGSKLARPPKIFQVNWFRRDADGRFLWPGFGENLRVLEWILKRCDEAADAQETAVGRLPTAGAIRTEGLAAKPDLHTLLDVQPDEWKVELDDVRAHLQRFAPRVPQALIDCLEQIGRRLDE